MTRILTFSGGDFEENGYLVEPGGGGPGWIVDPGAAAPSMVRHLQSRDLDLEAVLLTHAHLDHVEGLPTVREAFPGVPIYLHPDDSRLYQGVNAQARAFNLPLVGPLPPVDRPLAHGQTLHLGGLEVQVRHSPGHAPGHVIFVLDEEQVAFVGDVIFRGGIGRSDLLGGDLYQLMDSIRDQVITLPDATTLYSGHGPETSVGWERKTNPFLVGHFGGELA